MTAKLALVLAAAAGLYVLAPASEYSPGAVAGSTVSAGSSVPAGSPAPARAGCPRLLHLGLTDPVNGPDCIAKLQTALRQVTDPDQKVTGYFGGQTEKNVRKFQQRHHIDPTNGIAGPITQTVLRLATATAPPDLAGCPSLYQGRDDPINGRYCITTLQWALQHVRYPDGYPDQIINGYFRTQTEANVRNFQQHHHIPAIGVVGPETRAALLAALLGGGTPSAGPSTDPPVSPPVDPPVDPPVGEPQPNDDEFYYYYCGDGACHLYLSRSATSRYAQQLDEHPASDSVAKNLTLVFVCRVVRSLIFICTGLGVVVDAVADTVANKLDKAARQHACLHLSVGLSSTRRPDWRLFNAEPDNSRRCST
jgi:peptidoglycan hydrolase-like protein with peptidoglycan-binding domain